MGLYLTELLFQLILLNNIFIILFIVKMRK